MKQTTKVKLPAIVYREVEFDPIDLAALDAERAASDAKGPVGYPVSLSSELPVRRSNWGDPYHEVLVHDAEHVDLSRLAENASMPMLDSHTKTLGTTIGSVRNVKLDKTNRRLRGEAVFASTAEGQRAETLFREGHIRNISLGYQPTGARLSPVPVEKGIPTFHVSFQPREASMLPVPADHTVGLHRGEDDPDNFVEFEVERGEDESHTEGDQRMDPVPGVPPTPTTPAPNAAPAAPAIITEKPRDRAAEVGAIMEIAATYGPHIPADMTPLQRAQEWVRAGFTPEQAKDAVLELVKARSAMPPTQPGSESIDRSARDRKRHPYRVARAIAIATERALGNASKFNGLEAEVHQELAKRRKDDSGHGGVFLPFRDENRSEGEQIEYDRALMQRALGTGVSTGGQTLVATDLQPDLIDILRNKAVLAQAGARMLTGLSSNIKFMKKTGNATMYWMAENPVSPVTQSQPTFGSLTLSPKTLMGAVLYPRQLAVMANLDLEANLREDLGTGGALAIDQGGLTGTGSSNDPTGLYNTSGIPTVPFSGVPDLPNLVLCGTKMAQANALTGGQRWLADVGVAGVLMSKVVEPGNPTMLWNGNHAAGTLAGYPAMSSNQMPSSNILGTNDQRGLVLGTWSDLLIAMFGNDIEIVVDPYTQAGNGQIVITVYFMADCGIWRNESFVIGTGITIP